MKRTNSMINQRLIFVTITPKLFCLVCFSILPTRQIPKKAYSVLNLWAYSFGYKVWTMRFGPKRFGQAF